MANKLRIQNLHVLWNAAGWFIYEHSLNRRIDFNSVYIRRRTKEQCNYEHHFPTKGHHKQLCKSEDAIQFWIVKMGYKTFFSNPEIIRLFFLNIMSAQIDVNSMFIPMVDGYSVLYVLVLIWRWNITDNNLWDDYIFCPSK